MCITIPMRIVSVAGHVGCCEARGIYRDVRLERLKSDVVVGCYVLVHAGYALQMITATQARETWDLFDKITAAFDRAGASIQRPLYFMHLTEEAIR